MCGCYLFRVMGVQKSELGRRKGKWGRLVISSIKILRGNRNVNTLPVTTVINKDCKRGKTDQEGKEALGKKKGSNSG